MEKCQKILDLNEDLLIDFDSENSRGLSQENYNLIEKMHEQKFENYIKN